MGGANISSHFRTSGAQFTSHKQLCPSILIIPVVQTTPQREIYVSLVSEFKFNVSSCRSSTKKKRFQIKLLLYYFAPPPPKVAICALNAVNMWKLRSPLQVPEFYKENVHCKKCHVPRIRISPSILNIRALRSHASLQVSVIKL